MFAGARIRLLLLLLLLCLPLILASAAAAQGSIRVESNQVLVPAVVFDKKLYTLIDKREHRRSLSYLTAHNPHFLDSIVIRGLVAQDFHLFEDSREQTIQSVKFEAPAFSIVRDNLGRHPEMIGTGGGRWGYPDLPEDDQSVWLPWPQYVVAYIAPASPEGSCHQIRLSSSRSDVVVWARSEYCNTKHPATDPLSGTNFEKKMEADLVSATDSKIDLTLQVITLFRNTGAARVYIKLAFPWESLKYEFKNDTLYTTIGALGIVYDKNGSVVARFSDFACCDYGNDSTPSSSSQSSSERSNQETSMIPNHYEKQIDLPPGEFDIVVVLSDGEKFGRQQMLMNIANSEANKLSLSEVAICRRVRNVAPESPETPAKISESYSPLISNRIEFTPTMDTCFKKDETLYTYFEVYERELTGQTAATVEVHWRIVDARTGAIKIDYTPLDAVSYVTADSSLIPIGRGINLSSLPSGWYRLEVEITAPALDSTPSRTANFSVE